MEQLVIADVPDEVAERLRRRAAASGRTLEGEVRALLSSVAEPAAAQQANEPLGDAIAQCVLETGLTVEAWNDLDRSLIAIRSSRGDSLHRWVDFGGPEWDDLGPDE